jgi:hypothetical protein
VGPGLVFGPTILQQPQGVNITQGSSFALNVVAAGSGVLTYQWIKDGLWLDGATGPSYSVESALKAVHEGDYTVRMTDDTGETTSVVARVAILNNEIFDIIVLLPDSSDLIIDVLEQDTVASLKSRLELQLKIPVSEQTLWLDGLQLEDDQQTLGFYGVVPSSLVQLLVVTPPGPDYGSWSNQHFGTGEPNSQMGDDFDGDGVPNILEYAFGTSPTLGDSHSGHHPQSGMAGDRLRITFRRSVGAADLVWGLETADDPMGPWTVTPQSDWVEVSRDDQGDGTELVVWENVAGLAGVRFFRVTVAEMVP